MTSSSILWAHSIPEKLRDALAMAASGGHVYFYVGTVQRAGELCKMTRWFLDSVGTAYEARQRLVYFPRTGGAIRFAIRDCEIRGVKTDRVFVDERS